MEKKLLLVVRNVHGYGGIQQYCRDLMRACIELYGARVAILALRHPRRILWQWPVLLLQCLSAARRGVHIHFCDAVPSPIAFVVRLCVPGAHLTLSALGKDVKYPNRIYQWILRRSVGAFDSIVCISQYGRALMLQLGVDTSKLVVIPCGVWTGGMQSRPQPDLPVLLTVGRLVQRKGVAWFLEEVLPTLLQEVPTLTYIVVGDGPERDTLRTIVERTGTSSHVQFMGPLSQERRDAVFEQASLFVMPNIAVEGDMEGFGIVCIEAAIRGVPVAAARLEGLCDSVREGETGRFFSSQNAASAVDVIRSMLQDPLSSDRVARAAHEHFSWDTLKYRYATDVFHIAPDEDRPAHMGLRPAQGRTRPRDAVVRQTAAPRAHSYVRSQ